MRTRITELLGIEHPILLAPMTGTATAPLAAAVSAAGGFGFIGTLAQGGDWLRTQVQEVRAATAKPFGIGFIDWVIDQRPEMFDVALALKPHALSLSFGEPERYIEKVRMAGIHAIYQAQTVELARRAAAAGADAVVAQGTEAGGHTGSVSTLPLVPAVVDAISPVPVIAAGGIADGRGIAAALLLGADAVWIGTRFVASVEAAAHPNVKQRVVDARAADTILTHVYDMALGAAWPDAFAGRALRNTFTDRWHGHETELRDALDEQRSAVTAANQAGQMDIGTVYAGEASGLIDRVQPAAEIVRDLMASAEAVLSRRPGLLLGGML